MRRQLYLLVGLLMLSACRPIRMETPTRTASVDLEITLSRGACFGACPEYSVTITGDGGLVYNGKANVALKGEVNNSLSEATIQELIKAFQKAEYFSLEDSYTGRVSDMPTVITSIRYKGQTKRIVNYGSCLADVEGTAPQSLCDLEDKIDELAGISTWISKKPDNQ